MADRAQAPSGLGYALVNRIGPVAGPAHPPPGRRGWSARPGSSGPSGPAWPGPPPTGWTSPGWSSSPRDRCRETYFEHAYLASYLGYPLVEGRDLVVQNNRVWLRSLSGLDPVDVVIRRVDDQWCDPVELRADSLLGVPGLLEVVRRGRVTVLNPLGSGILESPGPDRPAGRPRPRPARRGPGPAGAGELVVRPARRPQPRAGPVRPTSSCCPSGPPPRTRPVRPALLTRPSRDDLRDRVLARPGDWVGQEIVDPSTVPTVTDDGTLVPRPVVLAHLRRGRRHSTTGHAVTACCPEG